MPFQLTHEAERRWVLVLPQLERARIAALQRRSKLELLDRDPERLGDLADGGPAQ